MQSWDAFDEECLPPKDTFYSTLNGGGISDAEYNTALNAWGKLGCETFGDYHDFYLMADVCLLADIFESYRDRSLQIYKLDPAQYITAPGMSFDAFLKQTKVVIDLLSDENMVDLIEKGLCGGISMASHNYARANNKYLPDYDPSKPSNFIFYVDMNNLYGAAMKMQLPIRNFMWSNVEFNESNIMSLSPDNAQGYIFEVDLDYPDHLHDIHNDYPLAAELFSPTGKDQDKMLIPNLYSKSHYVCHYRTLQFYLKHGLILKIFIGFFLLINVISWNRTLSKTQSSVQR